MAYTGTIKSKDLSKRSGSSRTIANPNTVEPDRFLRDNPQLPESQKAAQRKWVGERDAARDSLGRQILESGDSMPDEVDTGRPSPESVQAGAGLPGALGTVQFDSATGKPLAPGQTTVQGGQTLAQGSKYQQALTQLQGGAAPQTAGEGKGAAGAMLNQISPIQPDMSATDALLMEDKGWQGLMQMKEEYFNPENQKASLMDTYNKLYKNAGLEQLDEEIIDAQTVIEGTEDDIRNEVEQAGGFGTDSQVQALALSRNKVLLKNYNNLVALRESKAEHLGTMMNLAEKDRAYADQQFDRMLNYDMQMLNYRDKFVQNARDQYNKYTPQQLQAMLAGNPRQLAFAEQIMGVGPGGIAKLASAPLSEEDQLNLELKRSSLLTDKAQRANIYKNIEKTQQEIDVASNSIGGVDEKTMGKIQSSPEYKTINGVLPALQALKSYKDAVNNTNGYEFFGGESKGTLQGTYGNALSAWKSLAGLGALSGADFTLAENAVPKPGLFQFSSTMKGKINSSIDTAILQAETLTKRLIQNYPKASDTLSNQLDQMKVIAYPEKFISAPDGKIIEITN